MTDLSHNARMVQHFETPQGRAEDCKPYPNVICALFLLALTVSIWTIVGGLVWAIWRVVTQ